jgi:hypothetical protein
MSDVGFTGIVKNNIVIQGTQITIYLNKGQDILRWTLILVWVRACSTLEP